MNAIEIRDLSKSYKDFNLEHLNLTLPGGCIMGLVGENGAGKSTTIKLILNMIHRDCGSISILGRDNVTEMQSLKEDIGVVLDEVGLPECLNRRQVGNIMALTFKNWDSDYFEALCVKLGVPDHTDTDIRAELSFNSRCHHGVNRCAAADQFDYVHHK